MLDKSVDYKSIIMKMEYSKIQDIAMPKLPGGYSLRLFEKGDEDHWARVEASVLEFDSPNSAKDYFEKEYMPDLDELYKRCWFVLNPEGMPIATANSWFANSGLGHKALLDWVAVCPDYQGLGIGRAVVSQAVKNFREVEAGNDIWLHTQTWSHVALKLYHSLGFNLVESETVARTNSRTGVSKVYKNDFYEAVGVLKKVMPKDVIEHIISTSV